MTKPWISDRRQRASKAYQAVKIELQMDRLAKAILAQVDKPTRHRLESLEYKQAGGK